MNHFQKTLYNIGGYNPQVIKAGRLGAKYLLPGLSLFIVFITSSYGGWHLADTITSSWYRLFFTIGFVSLIVLVDYLLLQGEKSNWTAFMRVILSTTMGFIISLLTTLIIFKSDITANSNKNINNQTKTETADRLNEITYWKSLINDSIPKYDNLSTKAHKGDYITDDGKKIPACGGNELEQSYCRTFARKRDNFQNVYDENRVKITNEDAYIKVKNDEVKKRSPDGIIGQIENLWQLMLAEKVVLIGVILFFIFLMVIDLMPISVKYGIKDKLDVDYKAKQKELQDEKDATGNPLWYNSDKERFFVETEKERKIIEERKLEQLQSKNDLELKRIQALNDLETSKANEEAIKGFNSLYAFEKYQELLKYFEEKGLPEQYIKTIFDKLHKEATKNTTDDE